ncbi:MAG TPA: 16S rRNA (guanine(527)-N(7))-methyltransferase RsmG [Gammaproteobacteria bacterium]|nr:16S rRNA (guanine(527)-N(7))-methyltransferase RsmG [Gammaproteobacteria bacterium]
MADAGIDLGRVGSGLAAAGLAVSAEELRRLTDYLGLLVKWNRVYNLTGVRAADELVGRHLVESLSLAPLLRGHRIVDVGTGAGLPGIPLAIVEPERTFVLVESRAKRIRFLRHAVGTLALANVEVRHARIEDLRGETPFDTVLARAVAPPAELIRMTGHLMAPGTLLVLLTAARLEAEWRALAAQHALRPLALDPAPKLERSSIVLLERTHE